MGELNRTFTIKGDPGTVFLRCRKYWLDDEYALDEESGVRREEVMFLAFSRGKPSRNLFSFSLEKAHRKILIKIIHSAQARVSSVNVHFDFPWLHLSKTDLESVASRIDSFNNYLAASLEKDPFPTPGEEEELTKALYT